jgi:hypothetical protein
MSKSLVVKPLAGIAVINVTQIGAGWVIEARGQAAAPVHRVGSPPPRTQRLPPALQDLPAQGSPVTIMVDLERRRVVDMLADRSASSVAAWLSTRPSIEIISRDRHGLYAEGARIGAVQARQVADRFHRVHNLREMIEKQLSRLERPLHPQGSAAIEDEDTSAGLQGLRQTKFGQVRLLYDASKTATAITKTLGLSRNRVDKWIRLEAPPDRNAMAPIPRSPAYYQGHLSRR